MMPRHSMCVLYVKPPALQSSFFMSGKSVKRNTPLLRYVWHLRCDAVRQVLGQDVSSLIVGQYAVYLDTMSV